MAHFSDIITSAGAVYLAAADATIPFEAQRVTLTNGDATNDAFVVFGSAGAEDAAALANLQASEVTVPAGGQIRLEEFYAGEQQGFGAVECEVRIRSGAGTPAVVLNAEA